MIGYLKGKVFENTEGRLIVAVGGSEGAVGYSVVVPNGPDYVDVLPGRTIELFIYTHVREDVLDLYGFLSRAEKELFLTLLSVNGVGPKVAMGILSKTVPAQLISAVLEGDKEALTQIPGIGKKTAERVVLELADPLRKKVEAGVFGKVLATSEPGRKSSGMAGATPDDPKYRILRDAKDALVGLGYREQDVVPMLNRMIEEQSPKRVEDLIRTALQRLG